MYDTSPVSEQGILKESQLLLIICSHGGMWKKIRNNIYEK